MTGIRVVLLVAAMAAAVAPWSAQPAAAQDLLSLQARVMQLEARVRDITTFRPVNPAAEAAGVESLRHRVHVLELHVAETQNALKLLRADVDKLAAGKRQ